VQPLHAWVGFNRIRTLIDRQLRYLGPVRADPRPFYPVEDEPILGTRGKGAIPYLLKRRHDKVRYAAGPSGEIREGKLLEAINEWLAHMQVTTSLTIEPLESVAYTAAVRTPSVTGRSVNLAQVGFGISQLLPVLILGLKNPADGFLLFEQPEIHLHPRLQGGLGDFLIGVARAGRTVMVETHSDHLVNRVRRRIAEDTTGKLAEMVQILFVHAGTEDDPGSYVEPLSIDESGAIVNCPADFFSESSDEAFAILNARRKKRQTP
jgi:predicted ATPase